jgi:hypothetical protein
MVLPGQRISNPRQGRLIFPPSIKASSLHRRGGDSGAYLDDGALPCRESTPWQIARAASRRRIARESDTRGTNTSGARRSPRRRKREKGKLSENAHLTRVRQLIAISFHLPPRFDLSAVLAHILRQYTVAGSSRPPKAGKSTQRRKEKSNVLSI